ncbi:prolyl-tRNA synthetase [Thozetella sp. PMI_491]|nr:prolyl-tRNA synthetase [Thozetella sp. PMI_491]
MLRRVVPRLSKVWMPGGGFARTEAEDAHSKLVRAGFLRQSNAGIFHLLPLGRRVQDKIEGIIVKHMEDTLGASRVSLSSISSEALWRKSGRFPNISSELFKFNDRKDAAYLLAPTHEEEITTLVAKSIQSYKDLPLRLYQITRKYRDEARPRHGLLRGREFMMKDLYTFDLSISSALETYYKVREAYDRIFSEMKLPILAAKASSGDMGGDLSHEYHLPSSLGEDHVVSCNTCDYTINDELAVSRVVDKATAGASTRVWRGITKDRSTLVNVWYPSHTSSLEGERSYSHDDVNIYAAKELVPELDASIEEPLLFWEASVTGGESTAKSIVNLVDGRLVQRDWTPMWPDKLPCPSQPLVEHFYGEEGKPLNLLRIRDGDHCSQCQSGTLKVQKAVELGHTFHLGTRYSEPLEAKVGVPPSVLQESAGESTGSEAATSQLVPMQMGCHGIGVSRIIGAVADHLQDARGLNWPAAIAPYACVITTAQEAYNEDAVQLYHQLVRGVETTAEPLDAIVDDRKERLSWKLNDADLVGFPVIIVLGRDWPARKAEVQCRRLGFKEVVEADQLPRVVGELLAQL